MKKIVVKEVEDCEQLVEVYESDNDKDWKKIESFDPMNVYNSGVSIGYKGGGPRTLTDIILYTFNEYNKDKDYEDKYDDILEYISKLPNVDNFTILEQDVKHLL